MLGYSLCRYGDVHSSATRFFKLPYAVGISGIFRGIVSPAGICGNGANEDAGITLKNFNYWKYK
jgi:hypothetical protein